MEIKTVKFGGSSLCDAAHFRMVGDIIKSDPSRLFVVPSAPGKRSRDDVKITDMLYECYRLSREHAPDGAFDSVYEVICGRYRQIIQGIREHLPDAKLFLLMQQPRVV